VQAYAGLRSEEPLRELAVRHLHGGDPGAHAALDSDVAGDVEHDDGLAHAGASRDDDQVAGLGEQDPVQVDPRQRQGRRHPGVEVGEELLQHVVEVLLAFRAGGPQAGGQGLEFGDRGVQGGFGLVGVVAALHEPGTGLDQGALAGAFADDRGVVVGVRRGRHGLDEGVQVAGAADAGEVALLQQQGADGDRVGGFAAAPQVQDRGVDDAVRGPVVAGGGDLLLDVGDDVVGEEHATEDALLGLEVLGWEAFVAGWFVVGFVGVGGGHAAVSFALSGWQWQGWPTTVPSWVRNRPMVSAALFPPPHSPHHGGRDGEARVLAVGFFGRSSIRTGRTER
jgi:hypothetical protein